MRIRVVSVIAFPEKAGRSQDNSFFILSDKLFLLAVSSGPPSGHCRHASIRTLEERLVSLGASWAFSVQPVLPSVWRPVVLLFQSGTWARRLTQSPELGFGPLSFSSWNDFDFGLAVLFLRGCRNCHSVAVVQWLVHLSAHPQVMQHHRQFSCRGYDGSLLAVPSATLGQLQAPAPEITVDAKGSQDVLCSLH
jgi:hypothetical protein